MLFKKHQYKLLKLLSEHLKIHSLLLSPDGLMKNEQFLSLDHQSLLSIFLKDEALKKDLSLLIQEKKQELLAKNELFTVLKTLPILIKAVYEQKNLIGFLVFFNFFENQDQIKETRNWLKNDKDFSPVIFNKQVLMDFISLFNVTEELEEQLDPSTENSLDQSLAQTKMLRNIYSVMDKIKKSHYPVLIYGHHSFIKESLARLIHKNSKRADKNFLVLNCRKDPEKLERILFGDKNTESILEKAFGGSLYLEEVASLSLHLQSRLHKLIQSKIYSPFNSLEEKKADIRIIATSSKDLKELQDEKKFRANLYYSLSSIDIRIPALRNFEKDIQIFAYYFLKAEKSKKKISSEALKILKEYPWPGDVEELKLEIKKALIESRSSSVIEKKHLSAHLFEQNISLGSLKEEIQKLEKKMILDGWNKTRGNKTQLARILGISRSNLIFKIEQYGLEENKKVKI